MANRILISQLTALSASVSIGFEDAEIENAMPEDEQLLSVAETAQDEAEIGSDLESIARLEEQATGLEDLAEVADRVTEAGENEILLTDVAAEIATAGTDASVGVINEEEAVDAEGNPSLEAFVGKTISTEGIKLMAKNFWEAIKKMVANLWDKILGFYRRITDQVPGVVKQAKKLAERAKALTGKEVKEAKTDIKAVAGALSVNGKAPGTAADVLAGLSSLKTEASWFLDAYATKLTEVGKDVATRVAKFDLEKSESSLTAVAGPIVGLKTALTAHVKKKVTGDARFSKSSDVFASDALPGNRSVFYVASEVETDGSALGKASALRSTSVTLMMTAEKATSLPKEVTVATFQPSDCEKISDAAIELCSLVKQFNEKHLRALEKGRGQIKDASEKVNAKVTDATTVVDQKHWQAAQNFNTSYGKWCGQPFTQLTSLVLTTCRAAIVAGNRSLSNYAG